MFSSDFYLSYRSPERMKTLIIVEKPSQARDLRAAIGSRFGEILPAEGHLIRLAEPDEVNAGWKRWSCELLKPDGLYPTRAAREMTKSAKLRAIAAALKGCDGVILIGTTCDPFSIETVRATMGSLFAMRVAAASFAEFNSWRATSGACVIAASMRGDHAHSKADYGDRSIILMGNEQSGLPPDVESACNELVRIPMMGKADSLNLASAASVMIYEAWRRSGYKGANR